MFLWSFLWSELGIFSFVLQCFAFQIFSVAHMNFTIAYTELEDTFITLREQIYGTYGIIHTHTCIHASTHTLPQVHTLDYACIHGWARVHGCLDGSSDTQKDTRTRSHALGVVGGSFIRMVAQQVHAVA